MIQILIGSYVYILYLLFDKVQKTVKKKTAAINIQIFCKSIYLDINFCNKHTKFINRSSRDTRTPYINT